MIILFCDGGTWQRSVRNSYSDVCKRFRVGTFIEKNGNKILRIVNKNYTVRSQLEKSRNFIYTITSFPVHVFGARAVLYGAY